MLDSSRVKTRRVFIVFAYTIAILIAIAAIWFKVSELPVNYQMPSNRVLPQPNAYDTYTKAAKYIVYTEQIDEAIQKWPPTTDYQLAHPEPGNKKAPIVLPPGIPQIDTLTRFYNPTEKKAILKANTIALKLYKDGMKEDFLLPGVKCVDTRKFIKLRSLCQLLALQSAVLTESGQYGKAMDAFLDGLKVATDMEKGGPFMAVLDSSYMQTQLRRQNPDLCNILTLPETLGAISRLNHIVETSVTYKEMMLEDSHYNLSKSAELINTKNWRSLWVDYENRTRIALNRPLTWWDKTSDKWLYIRTFGVSRRGLFAGLENDYTQRIVAAKLPYQDTCKITIVPSNMLSVLVSPPSIESRFNFEFDRCTNEMLLIQLALHAYQLEHGRYPGSLNDLTPKYLKSIPKDRFNAGSPYSYILKSKGYRLYSVGPDLKDDIGTAVTRSNGIIDHYVVYNDTGDIVAGYNN